MMRRKRTTQVARKSTGGYAPRKQLASKAHRKMALPSASADSSDEEEEDDDDVKAEVDEEDCSDDDMGFGDLGDDLPAAAGVSIQEDILSNYTLEMTELEPTPEEAGESSLFNLLTDPLNFSRYIPPAPHRPPIFPRLMNRHYRHTWRRAEHRS
jgi:hypothetical protein